MRGEGRRLSLVIGVLAVVLLSAGCGGSAKPTGGVSGISGGGAPVYTPAEATPAQTPMSTPVPTPVPTPIPTPVPTPNTKAQAMQYMAAVGEGSQKVVDASTALQRCDSSDFTCVRDGLANQLAAARQFRATINSLPVPPCIAEVDKDLKGGLDDTVTGEEQMLAALDNLDMDAMQRATAVATEGTTHVHDATAHMDALDMGTC